MKKYFVSAANCFTKAVLFDYNMIILGKCRTKTKNI